MPVPSRVSFLVLLAAEWGDLSQLTTASLAARFGAPIQVWLGAWIALSFVGALGGARRDAGWSRACLFPVVRRISGALLALLALVTLAEAAGLWSGF